MIQNSLILSFALLVLQKLQEFYKKSLTAAVMERLSRGFRACLSGSSIWGFVSRRDVYSNIWSESRSFRLLQTLFNLPPRFFGYLRDRAGLIIQNSLIIRAVGAFTGRFEVVLGIFLAAVMLAKHQWWNNLYNTAIILLLFFIFCLRPLYGKKAEIDFKPLDVAFVLFMLSMLMAAVTSVNAGLSMRFAIFYITGFLLVLITGSSIRTAEELKALLNILLFAVTITGLYGLYQAYTGVPVDPSLTDVNLNDGLPGRIYSTMGNANNYAEFLVLMLPFYAAAVLNARSWLGKLFFTALALPPAAALLLTLSRSGMIALAVAALVFLFFKNRKLIPVLIILGVAALPFLPQFVYKRILTIFNPNDTSASYRILIYKTMWPILKDYWVTGIGLGTDSFMKISQHYFQHTNVIAPHSHNVYLQVWLEGGLAAIISFLWFLGRTFKKCARAISDRADAQTAHILMAGAASLAGVLVMSLAEYVWFYPRVFFFFWMDIGVLFAGLRIISRKTGEEDLKYVRIPGERFEQGEI